MKTKLFALISWVGFVVSAISEWGLDIDLPLTPAPWLAMAAAAFFATNAPAALTTNRWQVNSGKWEIGANWNNDVPSLAHAATSIANNAPVGGGVISVDNTTVLSNLINNCMVVSNLTVAGNFDTGLHTLSLNNAILTTPLVVLNSLTISSGGSVSVSNAALRVSGLFFPGSLSDSGALLLDAGGTLFATNVFIGVTSVGFFTVADGSWDGRNVLVGAAAGSRGTLNITGGSVTLNSGGMLIGYNHTGDVWMTGGQLISTNSNADIGQFSVGQFTLSNGNWLAGSVNVGSVNRGTLTVAGGTLTMRSNLGVGSSASATGAVWLTGGQIIATNAIGPTANVTHVGDVGSGRMSVSNATLLVSVLNVGENIGSVGTFTLAGGSATINSAYVGIHTNATGSVWITGGQLLGFPQMEIGYEGGVGKMTISNGTCRVGFTTVGNEPGSEGTLTVAGGTNAFAGLLVANQTGTTGAVLVTGGTVTVDTSLRIGNENCDPGATLLVNGGSLFVTNAAHFGQLEILSADVRLLSGTLAMDKLLLTNPCGRLVRSGGTLSITETNLAPNLDADGDGLPNGWEIDHGFDPFDATTGEQDADGDGVDNFVEYWIGTDPKNPHDPFRVTAIERTNNDIRITWQYVPPPGNDFEHCVVEASTTVTGAWNSVSGQITLPSDFFVIASTNFVETGGATNKPSRFYHVRLVP